MVLGVLVGPLSSKAPSDRAHFDLIKLANPTLKYYCSAALYSVEYLILWVLKDNMLYLLDNSDIFYPCKFLMTIQFVFLVFEARDSHTFN
jgi:hypothetical protein